MGLSIACSVFPRRLEVELKGNKTSESSWSDRVEMQRMVACGSWSKGKNTATDFPAMTRKLLSHWGATSLIKIETLEGQKHHRHWKRKYIRDWFKVVFNSSIFQNLEKISAQVTQFNCKFCMLTPFPKLFSGVWIDATENCLQKDSVVFEENHFFVRSASKTQFGHGVTLCNTPTPCWQTHRVRLAQVVCPGRSGPTRPNPSCCLRGN